MEKLMYSSSNELRTAWSGAEQNKPSLSYHEAELKEIANNCIEYIKLHKVCDSGFWRNLINHLENGQYSKFIKDVLRMFSRGIICDYAYKMLELLDDINQKEVSEND